MDTVHIAFATEPYEKDVLVGVFATPALAHRALGEYLANEPSMEGYVEARTVHKE